MVAIIKILRGKQNDAEQKKIIAKNMGTQLLNWQTQSHSSWLVVTKMSLVRQFGARFPHF